jgi:hypothetical protein
MNDSVVRDFDTAMESSATPVQEQTMPPVMKEEPMQSKRSLMIPVLVAALILGVGTGYLLFTKSGTVAKLSPQMTGDQTAVADKVEVGKVYGSTDSTTFKDSAEGVLLVGGANGEGSHHIVREGGESQNVYLTSSVVDLKMFENHKILVRGETFSAQRAGWLMDVGQIKVLELNAQLPDWAKEAAEEAEMNADTN